MAPDFNSLVEDTKRFFAEHRHIMSRAEGTAIRRNTDRLRTLRAYEQLAASGAADAWVQRMEADTLAGRANYDAELRDIAADFIVRGAAVPPVLRPYTRKILHGTFQPKRRKKGEHAGDNLGRNIVIANRVEFLHRSRGLPVTGNSASEMAGTARRPSACSIVAAAIGTMTASAVRTVWRKYRPRG